MTDDMRETTMTARIARGSQSSYARFAGLMYLFTAFDITGVVILSRIRGGGTFLAAAHSIAESETLRVMQNPGYYKRTSRCPECIENWRHAAQDNRQRLLRTIERRFLTPNLSHRRSRCDSIVCRDLTQRNSMNWSRWSANSSKNHGIKEKGARAN